MCLAVWGQGSVAGSQVSHNLAAQLSGVHVGTLPVRNVAHKGDRPHAKACFWLTEAKRRTVDPFTACECFVACCGCLCPKLVGAEKFAQTFISSLSKVGTGKRGHYERGLFTGGISRISKISNFSRIS